MQLITDEWLGGARLWNYTWLKKIPDVTLDNRGFGKPGLN
jgi:hypothetical protein